MNFPYQERFPTQSRAPRNICEMSDQLYLGRLSPDAVQAMLAEVDNKSAWAGVTGPLQPEFRVEQGWQVRATDERRRWISPLRLEDFILRQTVGGIRRPASTLRPAVGLLGNLVVIEDKSRNRSLVSGDRYCIAAEVSSDRMTSLVRVSWSTMFSLEGPGNVS